MMTHDRFFVASKRTLALAVNREKWQWSYGIHGSTVDRADYDCCKLRLRLHIGTVPELSSKADAVRYHYFSGIPGGDELRYARRFGLHMWLQLHLRGLLTDEPTLTVNPTYARYIKHRFMNLHSVNYILTDIAALTLLRLGHASLHCSAFHRHGATVVVFAAPNGGKTLTTMMACTRYDADFIAEDLAITDGLMLHSVPDTSTFRYYSDVDGSVRSRLLNGATRLFPPLELLGLGRMTRGEEFLGRCRIRDSAPISHVVILEQGRSSVEETSLAEARRKILNLNRYEFNYLKAPILVASSFFNPSVSLDSAYDQERTIVQRMLENAVRLTVRAPTPIEYAPLLADALG